MANAAGFPMPVSILSPFFAGWRAGFYDMNDNVRDKGMREADAGREYGHVRSFVRRLGRMSTAQARYFDTMMPKIGVPYAPAELDLGALFARPAARKILEIGCGMGETTAHIAAAHPENDYLGVEVHTPGVGSLCKQVAERELGNVRIICHDAVEVVRDMLPEASLDGVHIFFPDPWHKKRHHKRRLIQLPFVTLLARRLKSGGYLHCATDWEAYAEQMLEVLSAISKSPVARQNSAVCQDAVCQNAVRQDPLLQNTAEGYALRPEYRPLTKFEQRGLRLGHGVWDLVFRRL
jgi:tRNA (guanine-N7-)-methyltransferase